MRRIAACLLVCTALAGCAACPANDTALMPLTAQGAPAISQNQAIALSSWALKDPANTLGKPELAAQAIAAEDWLAGQSMLSSDFGSYAPVHEMPWVALRGEVRAAIGVAPGTPSQLVVEHLLAAADALHAGNRAGAEAQLQPPAFSLGPQATLAALARLPAFSGWATAYNDLARHEFRSSSQCGLMRLC